MLKNVAILGSSIDPATRAHIEMVRRASTEFDQVRITPCGPRPDKATVNDTPPQYRALMTDLMVQILELPNVVADLADVEREEFTPTWQLDKRVREETGAEVWHIIGADLVSDIRPSGGRRGWSRGEELWHKANFLLFKRPGYDLSGVELPPNHKLVEFDEPVSSTEVRKLVTNRELYEHLLHPEIAKVVSFYELYRGKAPKSVRKFRFEDPRLTLICHPARRDHPAFWRIADGLKDLLVHEDCNGYLIPGGDGDMLATVNRHWRDRKPFLGLNLGHVGFLHNDIPEDVGSFVTGALLQHECPMLHVEVRFADGSVRTEYAFNDAYLKAVPTAEYDTTGWFEVGIEPPDGEGALDESPKQLMADGVLVCTPQGSTGYAFSAGGDPFSLSDSFLRIIGLNISRPRLWKTQLISMDTEVELVNLDTGGKRPVRAFVDGRAICSDKTPVRMSIRKSRVAFANILLGRNYSFDSKMRQLITVPDFTIA